MIAHTSMEELDVSDGLDLDWQSSPGLGLGTLTCLAVTVFGLCTITSAQMTGSISCFFSCNSLAWASFHDDPSERTEVSMPLRLRLRSEMPHSCHNLLTKMWLVQDRFKRWRGRNDESCCKDT